MILNLIKLLMYVKSISLKKKIDIFIIIVYGISFGGKIYEFLIWDFEYNLFLKIFLNEKLFYILL